MLYWIAETSLQRGGWIVWRFDRHFDFAYRWRLWI